MKKIVIDICPFCGIEAKEMMEQNNSKYFKKSISVHVYKCKLKPNNIGRKRMRELLAGEAVWNKECGFFKG